MDSVIPELATRTAREAGLDDEWIEAFRPLFRVERVDRDGMELIEIAFDYLGERSCYEWSDDPEELMRTVADAARSFGYTLKVEREKFGRLDKPRVAGLVVADRAEEEQTGLMRALAVGMIVLAVLILGLIGLSVMGSFMVETDKTSDLIVSAAAAGAALLMLWGGVRLLGRS